MYLYVAKKNRTAIPINLTAVSRRHLLYESQSCKKRFFQQTPVLHAIPNSRVAAIPNSGAARTPAPLILEQLLRTRETYI